MVFEVAHSTLPHEAQVLFRRLALVPGPDFTGAVATCLTGSAAALPLLVNAGLLESHAPGRYRFPESSWRFAAERCRVDEPDAHSARARLFDYLVRAADDASFAWLEVELPNLLAAVRDAAARGPLVVASQLALALQPYFSARLRMPEWIEVLHLALEASQRDDDPVSAGRNHLMLSDAYWHLCELGRSEIHLEFAEASAVDEVRSIAFNHRGRLLMTSGRLTAAVPVFEEGISLARSLGHSTGVVIETCLLGEVCWELGALDRARTLLLSGLASARTLDYRLGAQIALARLAQVVQTAGAPREAVPLYVEALELAHGHALAEASTLVRLGSAWRDLGRYQEALACAASVPSWDALLRPRAGAQHLIGSTLVLMGEDGVPALERGLSLASQASFPRTQGDCLVSLASATGDRTSASRASRLCPEHALIQAACRRLLAPG